MWDSLFVFTDGTNGKVSCPSKRICLLLLQKEPDAPFMFIPIHYIPIVGGYMVDGYEMGGYKWPSMSLRYPINSYINCYTLTAS